SENVSSAAAIDMAWLSNLFGVLAGTAHGVVICEAEGIDLGEYAKVLPEGDVGRWMVNISREASFSKPGAALSVWNAGLRRIRSQARDASINSEVPDFVAGLLDRAEAAGHGN